MNLEEARSIALEELVRIVNSKNTNASMHAAEVIVNAPMPPVFGGGEQGMDEAFAQLEPVILGLQAGLEKARSFLREDEWQQVVEVMSPPGSPFHESLVTTGERAAEQFSEQEIADMPLANSDAEVGGPHQDPASGADPGIAGIARV